MSTTVQITEFVQGLSDAELTELGRAIRTLPKEKFALVVAPLEKYPGANGRALYHLDTAVRSLLGDMNPQLTSSEVIRRQRQME